MAEAFTTDASGPLLVRGYVVAQGDEVRLCEQLDRSSSPPRCEGEAATLEGYDARALPESSDGVSWSEEEISLLVTRDGNSLVLSATSR